MISAATRFAIADLYSDYGAALDEQRYQHWIDLFIDDCRYIIQPRENYDSQLPLATVRLESKAMLKDRIHGVTETLYHAPYYQRHIVGGQRVKRKGAVYLAEANYVVIRTHSDQPSDILSAGQYIDTIVDVDGVLKFAHKLCVFDTELIPNSLIYPI
ncbi:MAG: aromatic-ring-hydroxylating dioxygenase subunit beta [Sphingopyxis sp.]|nr:aromatic-ring-hydroxylating dioxygenase subunit beta [Sphingopyxis sp.]